MNNPVTKKPTTTASSSRSTYKAPTPKKSTSTSSSSSSGGQDPICAKNCDAEGIWANLYCRLQKMGAYCGGNAGGPPLEGNIFYKSGLGSDPLLKNEICAKNCEPLDVFCKSAKLQAGCGGSDYTFWLIAGAVGVVGLIILLRR